MIQTRLSTFAKIIRLFPAEARLAITSRSVVFRLAGLVRFEARIRIADDASVNPTVTQSKHQRPARFQ